MKTLEVQVSDDVARKIAKAAEVRGVSIEDLVRSSVEEKLAREAEFAEAAEHVLKKNAELYKRLA